MADWNKIKTEYITTDISYRDLAKKHGVPQTTLFERGRKEKWVDLREQHRSKAETKALDKIANQQANRAARIDRIADKLLDKIEKAVEELDIQIAKHTKKIKEIEYNNLERPDKPTKETIYEEEKLIEVHTIVDRQGVQQLTTALEKLKDIKMVRSKADEEEQQARIEALRAKVAKDEDDEDTGVILLPSRRETAEDGE